MRICSIDKSSFIRVLCDTAGLFGAIFVLLAGGCWADDAFGTWSPHSLERNPPRSGIDSKIVAVRIGFHLRGEVFTLDQVDRAGRSTTSSTILYFDSKEREFNGFGCSGTQSSRRLDSQTVEILRTCRSGEWIRFVRRLSSDAKELVLEITEQQTGVRIDRRLVLEKQ